MRDCSWTWRWTLKSSPEKLWPLVADTDRFNRFTGLPPVQFSMVPVGSHFKILDKIIQRNHGAQVKNIGDAVMAVFGKPADALKAAVEMHHELKALRTSDGREVVLKSGLHAGPCFAVTLNDNLDYFGTTVNLAARIQGQSDGEDIVLEAQLAASLCAPTDFPEFDREEFETELKGIDGSRRLLRLRLR